jgi:Ca2+-binding EF-hand superfamily protein
MGAVLQKYSAPRDSYDVVQVLEPIEQVEIRTGPPQLPRVGKSNVNSQIQELFEHVLEAFDIKSQKNAFMDVKALMAQFNNDLEVEKISLKLTKHVFDHYDTNHNGYLELAEIEPFCTDLLCLFGEKADRERILNMEKELLKCVSKGENGLTFVNFWSSEVLKGKIVCFD